MKLEYKYQAALTAAIAIFMAVLDSTIVNVSLVAMMKDFGTNLSSIQWVVTAYTLAQAAVIPISGYLANRFGIKRLFMIALAVFTIGSLLCGLTRDFTTGSSGETLLIAFRVVQALGGGMLIPIGSSIAFAAFRPEERAASSAMISIPVLFAPALGPTVGGLIVDSRWEWPAIFFINVPIGIIALWLIARVVKPDEKQAHNGLGFDFAGLFLSMVGIVMAIYAFVLVGETKSGSETATNPAGDINGWGYWLVWVLLLGGLALLAAFVYVEMKIAKDPVLDLSLFKNREFAAASIVTWGTRATIFGAFLLVPLFLQQYRGQSAVHTGLILSAQGLGAILGIQVGSRLFDRIGPRALVTLGMVVLVAGTVWLTFVDMSSDWQFFIPVLFIRGIGFGWVGFPLQTVAMARITGRALPKASSLYNATAQIFTSIGTAVVTTLLVQRQEIHVDSIVDKATAAGQAIPDNLILRAGTDGMSDVYWILTVATVLVGIFVFWLPKFSIKQEKDAAGTGESGADSRESMAASLH